MPSVTYQPVLVQPSIPALDVVDEADLGDGNVITYIICSVKPHLARW
jgi:hypothetical protein